MRRTEEVSCFGAAVCRSLKLQKNISKSSAAEAGRDEVWAETSANPNPKAYFLRLCNWPSAASLCFVTTFEYPTHVLTLPKHAAYLQRHDHLAFQSLL